MPSKASTDTDQTVPTKAPTDCNPNEPLTSERHPYPPDELGGLINTASLYFSQSASWEDFVLKVRDPAGDLHPKIRDINHPAAAFLDDLREEGATANMTTPPWTKGRISAALARGPHKFANEFCRFLREEFMGIINKGHWTLLPASLVQGDIMLRLSPLGVVPQRDRRPRMIGDYTYFGVNDDTDTCAPREAMQFGKALHRVIQVISNANPQFGDNLPLENRHRRRLLSHLAETDQHPQAGCTLPSARR